MPQPDETAPQTGLALELVKSEKSGDEFSLENIQFNRAASVLLHIGLATEKSRTTETGMPRQLSTES
jgi:hypothetical protein